MSFALIDDFLNLHGIKDAVETIPFDYKPLNTSASEIRLVRLHPGEWTSNVEVSLFNVSLDTKPSYEALSYTWGKPDITRRILVNGKEFRVTENLEIGLRHLRAFEVTVLWIDAICINQNDLEERAQQVRRMKTIYDQATQVVAWLGPEGDDSAIAMQRMRKFKNQHKWHIPILHNFISWDDSELIGDVNHAESVRAWKAISQLFRRPWFSRAWVVQEASGLKNLRIICGKDSTDFVAASVTSMIVQDLIMRPGSEKKVGYTLLEEVRASVSNFLLVSSFKGTRLQKKSELDQLLYLLPMFRQFDTTDPRDKIYTCLSFERDVPDLVPDYRLSVGEVYSGLVKTYIQSKKDLDILGYCRSTDFLVGGLPCWVPDWRSNNRREAFSKYVGDKRVYKASGDTQAKVGKDDDESTLTLEGLYIDTIARIAPSHKTAKTAKEMIALDWSILDLEEASSQSGHKYLTGESLLDAYLKTIVADFSVGFDYSNHRHEADMHELATSQNATYQTVEGLDNVKKMAHRGFAMSWKVGPNGGVQDEEGYRDYAEAWDGRWALHAATDSRRFFQSAKGYIGLVPEEASEGDLICILNGGAVPYALWNNNINKGTYQFLGECYVHGLMDGEAMKDVEDGKVVSQMFPLI